MTATLLPNGRQVFADENGTPIVGGKVYMYIPATETFKNTWQDSGESTLNTNPIILDDLGSAVIYGSGSYRQYVTDEDDNLIWDELTADTLSPLTTFITALQTQSTGSPTTTGTGLVGLRIPGGTSRTLYQKMQELVSVKDFGAVGDGSTNDTTAIQATITYLSGLGGGMLYFPRGTYVITTVLTIANMDIAIVGDGEGVSVIRASANINGLSITQNNADYFTTIRNISLYTTQLGLGNAIVIDYSAASTSGNPTERCVIENVEMKASGTQSSAGWLNGIVCTDVTSLSIKGGSFIGYATAATPTGRTNSTSAILLQGANSPVEAFIHGFKAYFCVNGVEIIGSYEGVFIGGQCAFIQVSSGVNWHMSTGNNPLLFVNSSHVSAFLFGVRCVHGGQINISDNLIYRSEVATADATGVYLESCLQGVVSGNLFYDSLAANGLNGVVCATDAAGIQIRDNCYREMATATWFQAGSFRNIVTGNVYYGDYTNSYLDSGSGNAIGRRGVMVYVNNDQSITSGVSTALSFDAAYNDTDGFWSSGTNITIPASRGVRKIRITAGILWDANATANRGLQIQKNGSATYLGAPGNDIPAPATGNAHLNCTSGIIDVAEGDVFTVVVVQNSGGGLNILGSQRSWCSIEVIE